MDPSDAIALLIAGAAGAGLGVIHFVGLWLTVKRLPESRRPALLMAGSLLLRLAAVLAGLYLLVRGGHWGRLLVGLTAFVLVRVIATRRLRPQGSSHLPEGSR